MRLFVAIDLPSETKRQVDALTGGIAGADWKPTDTLHLTLRFLGETGPELAEETHHALEALRVPAFDLVLSGTGSFRRPSGTLLLWVGVERSPALEHLQHKVDHALLRAGAAPERRRFVPHVSLATLDPGMEAAAAGWMQRCNLFRTLPFRVDSFCLFSSHPGGSEPDYVVEAEYGLVA